ncbi:RNA polymerase II-associated protein [Mycena venus]|uniref:RNA polymerase II-associated protein n=1 Tax=Mycena venus TaxID=2733690 RepID=A0A8H7D1B9_9AGAR|nr:RNA polymerase II-associated protein [Mycena venus]
MPAPSNSSATMEGPQEESATLANGQSPEKSDDRLVSLDPSEDPLCLSTFRKWLAVAVIAAGSFCVTCASSMVYGRAIIYRVSYVLLVVLSFPVVFAPNLAVALVFRFFLGMAGASFLSVAGGSIADMFSGPKVATPMAIYTISPFLGPVLGPILSGFINQNLYWRWTYRILLIWSGVEMVAIFLFVPESYAPVLLKRKAAKLRKETGDQTYWAPLDRHDTSFARSLLLSCYVPFKLLIFERMALLLDTWNALLLGILYLMFQAFPLIFENGHHFNVQTTGLTFLGIGIGMGTGLATQPFWNRLSAREAVRHGGKAPSRNAPHHGPSRRDIALYWFAFTTYPHVHWIVPIIASIPFGTGVFFAFTATFTYLVTAYRPIAASAMASNSAMRSTFAAVFPLFAGAMYEKLGTVGATALLAGLATLMAPLPFVFVTKDCELMLTLLLSSMNLKRDIANGSSAAAAAQMLVCSGCTSAKYRRKECQAACSPSHKQTSLFTPPPHLAGIRVRAVTKRDPCDDGLEFSARKIVEVSIEHENGDKVGIVKIDLVNIIRARQCGFFNCLDALSGDLSNLALHFDNEGGLLPGRGWNPENFKAERHIVFLDEFVIETAWRGRGLGSWLLPKLFDLENLLDAKFIFTRPDVLQYTDSGFRYSPPPVGRAAEALFVRIVHFYETAGFRRVGNSQFFCLTKNPSLASYSCPT